MTTTMVVTVEPATLAVQAAMLAALDSGPFQGPGTEAA
jgi:hypothetical protein